MRLRAKGTSAAQTLFLKDGEGNKFQLSFSRLSSDKPRSIQEATATMKQLVSSLKNIIDQNDGIEVKE